MKKIKDNKYKPLSDWALDKYGANIRPDQIKRNDKEKAMEIWKVFFKQYFLDNPGEVSV